MDWEILYCIFMLVLYIPVLLMAIVFFIAEIEAIKEHKKRWNG